MRPPRLRCTLFPLIYPPHLLVLPATLGLHLFWQTYPYFRALYVISVRRTKSLLTASFRFHLTMDTLAVLLYTSSLPRRVRDFHPLERTHGAQTKKSAPEIGTDILSVPQPPCSSKTSDIHYVQSYVISITGNPRENLPDVILSAFLLRDDFQNKPPTVFQHRQLSVGKSLISTLSLHRI